MWIGGEDRRPAGDGAWEANWVHTHTQNSHWGSPTVTPPPPGGGHKLCYCTTCWACGHAHAPVRPATPLPQPVPSPIHTHHPPRTHIAYAWRAPSLMDGFTHRVEGTTGVTTPCAWPPCAIPRELLRTPRAARIWCGVGVVNRVAPSWCRQGGLASSATARSASTWASPQLERQYACPMHTTLPTTRGPALHPGCQLALPAPRMDRGASGWAYGQSQPPAAQNGHVAERCILLSEQRHAWSPATEACLGANTQP